MNQHVFSIYTKHFTVDVNSCNTQLLPHVHPQLYLPPDLEQTQRKPPESHTQWWCGLSSFHGALMSMESTLLWFFSLPPPQKAHLTLVGCSFRPRCWSSGSESEPSPLRRLRPTWLLVSDSDSDRISCGCKSCALPPAVSSSAAVSLSYVLLSPLGAFRTPSLHWAAEGCSRSSRSCCSTSGLYGLRLYRLSSSSSWHELPGTLSPSDWERWWPGGFWERSNGSSWLKCARTSLGRQNCPLCLNTESGRNEDWWWKKGWNGHLLWVKASLRLSSSPLSMTPCLTFMWRVRFPFSVNLLEQ